MNAQPGILGPGPALPPHVAVRLMRMRLMPPMAFPFADMQRFAFDPSMMPSQQTETAEVSSSNAGKYILTVHHVCATYKHSLSIKSSHFLAWHCITFYMTMVS